jgi:hypothetical protein
MAKLLGSKSQDGQGRISFRKSGLLDLSRNAPNDSRAFLPDTAIIARIGVSQRLSPNCVYEGIQSFDEPVSDHNDIKAGDSWPMSGRSESPCEPSGSGYFVESPQLCEYETGNLLKNLLDSFVESDMAYTHTIGIDEDAIVSPKLRNSLPSLFFVTFPEDSVEIVLHKRFNRIRHFFVR